MSETTPTNLASKYAWREVECHGLPKRSAPQRAADFLEIYGLYDEAAAREQASRCIQCPNPTCVHGCPICNPIPEWMQLTAEGRFLEAAAVLGSVTNLVKKADAVVNLYETTATAKVNRLRAIQVTFLACALALLAMGAWVTRRSLLKPLQDLSLIAKRLGENDLDSPVQIEGPAEMRALSQVFDEMRIRLHTAREELKQWNATLEQRIAQRTLELETLNEVSREISSRLDIQQVLDSVTEKARALLGGEIASLCLVDETQHWLRLQAVSGPKEAVTGQVAAVNEGLAPWPFSVFISKS